MKFLLDFVSCCRSCSKRMVEEETTSLVPEGRRERGRKRGRLAAVRAVGGGGGGSQVAEWRPTLSSISEDNMLPERNEKVVGSEKVIKRKKASSTPKPRPHHYHEDVGRAPISAIMPALSPTPFLF